MARAKMQSSLEKGSVVSNAIAVFLTFVLAFSMVNVQAFASVGDGERGSSVAESAQSQGVQSDESEQGGGTGSSVMQGEGTTVESSSESVLNGEPTTTEGAAKMSQDEPSDPASSQQDAMTYVSAESAREPRDLTGAATTLTFTAQSNALAFDNEKPATIAADASVLPDSLPATLTFEWALAPEEGEYVRPGDTFRLLLPEGVSFVDGQQPIEVKQKDGDAVIAEASVADEQLLFTMRATDNAALVESGALDAGTVVLESGLCAKVSLGVQVASSLLRQDEGGYLDWTMQVATNGGADQVASIALPSQSELMESWGIAANSKMDTSALVAAPAARSVEPSGSTTVALNKHWISSGPVASDVASKMMEALFVEYSLDGADSFTRLSAETKDNLGLAEVPAITVANHADDLTKYECAGLPSKIVETAENGTSAEKDVTYRIVEDAGEALAQGYIKQEGATSSDVTNIEMLDFKIKVHMLVGQAGTGPLDDEGITYKVNGVEVDRGNLECTGPDDSGSYTITVKGLPAYDANGAGIVYSLTAEGPQQEGADGYKALYDNAGVPNYSAVTTAAYNGGTLSLARTGSTAFSANKVWLDYGSSPDQRPFASLELWRFTAKYDGDKLVTDFTQASPVRDNSGIPITISVDGTVESGVSKAYSYSGLDKYDPEGYEYVYLARETLQGGEGTGSYEKVFEQEGAQDTLPTGYGDEREDGDESIYNGGTLGNRITGTVTVPAEKTWHAAAHQRDLGNVTVVLELLKRPANSDGSQWESSGITRELSGFTAEWLTQSTSASAPRYDSQGRELEYQWREAEVLENGQPVTLNSDGTFDLACTNNDKTEDRVDKEWFRSVSEQVDEEGFKGTKITNTLEGEVDYLVKKYWNGELTGAPEGAEVTINLYANSELQAEKSHTMKKTDPENWAYTFSGLPKFNEQGYEISYEAREGAVNLPEGWTLSDVVYSSDRAVSLYNTNQGAGFSIDVRKAWLDDDDVDRRAPVKIGVYWNSGTSTIAEDDKELTVVTVSQETSWRTRVGISAPEGVTGEDWKSQIYTKELSMVDSSLSSRAVSYDGQGFEDAVGNTTVGNIAGSIKSANAYKVSNYRDDDGVYVSENLRVGLTAVTATKSWADLGATSAERPKAFFELYVTQGDVVFKGTEYTVDGKETHALVNAQGAAVGSSQAIDVNQDPTYAYTWYGLPKYDTQGRMINYSVKESSENMGEYASSIASENYQVDKEDKDCEYGFRDDIQYAFANARVGSTTVEFAKEWNDAHAFMNGNRPDIYLTLYEKKYASADATEQTVSKVEGNPTYHWNEASDPGEGGQVGVIDNYSWKALFEGLPKYDARGAEIVYYAQEQMHDDASEFDYQPVFFKMNGTVVTEATEGDDVIAFGGAEILKQGGTFVNALQGNAVFTGAKVWNGISEKVPADQLPVLDISVKQYVDTDGDGALSDDERANQEAAASSVATYSKLASDNTFEASFDISVKGENNPEVGELGTEKLPKYDAMGHLCVYELEESLNADAPQNVNFKNDPTGAKFELVYTPSSAGHKIINTLNADGSLTVMKEWKSQPTGDGLNYAVATFKLYRAYDPVGVNGGAASSTESTKEFVGQKTTTKPTEANASSSATFDGLPAYAPNGSLYKYWVEEVAADGFTATLPTNADGTSFETRVALDRASGHAIEVGSYVNTYSSPTLTLTGEKKWEDYGNAMGVRPEGITITLTRTADSQPGANNAITQPQEVALTEGAGGNLTWTKSATDDTWTYSISGLDQYAPNGMPWKYQVKEDTDSLGWYVATKTTASANAKDAAGDAQVGLTLSADRQLVNGFGKRASATKSWSGDISSLRPAAIVKLQVLDRSSVGSEHAWVDAKDFFPAGTYENLKGKWNISKGSIHLSNLPSAKNYSTSGTASIEELHYRFVETKIGDLSFASVNEYGDGRTIVYSDLNSHQYTPGGSVEFGAYGTGNDKTMLTNTLGVEAQTSLVISKTWDDKSNTMNHPDLTFTIQRSTDGASYSDVKKKNADGKDSQEALTFVLKPTDTLVVSDKTLNAIQVDGLPAYDASGAAYSYRAKEDSNGLGKNYASSVQDGVIDGAGFHSQWTNALETVTLSGTKEWIGGDASVLPAPDSVDVVLKRSTSEQGSFEVVPEGQRGKFAWTQSGADRGVWTFEYSDLPKANSKGTPYIYKVEDSVDGWRCTAGVSKPAADGSLSVALKNTGYALQVNKTSAFDGTVENAQFELAPDTGSAFTDTQKASVELTTDSGGVVSVPAGLLMANNAYILKETVPPAGHVLNTSTFKFTVNADGTIAPAASSVDGYVVKDNVIGKTPIVSVSDEPTLLDIVKVSEKGAEPLAGAEFSLQALDGATFAGGESALILTSNEDGKLVVDGVDGTADSLQGQLAVGASYRLTELVAPAGYQNALDSLTFAVGADGSIEVVGEIPAGFAVEGLRTESDTPSVTVSNTALEAKIVKTDLQGKPLSGAEFTIEGPLDEGDASAVKTFVVGADGAVGVSAAQFTVGKQYRVTETKAPEGYELAGSMILTVKPDGTFAVDSSQPGKQGVGGVGTFAVSEVDGIAIVTVADAPIAPDEATPTPVKSSKTGDALGVLFAGLGAVAVVAAGAVAVAMRRLRKLR
ncbi:MAG: Cna B-type domain-containing protein [Eggerthellaceae bacterium]